VFINGLPGGSSYWGVVYLCFTTKPTHVNNKLSLALNVVLLIAVGVLFYLHFSSPKTGADAAAGGNDSIPKLSFDIPSNLGGARVLYINVDSLDAKYEAISELSKATEAQLKSLQATYQAKRDKLQQLAYAYQQKVQLGTISVDEAQRTEAELNKGGEELAALEAQVQRMSDKAYESNDKILEDVNNYFKDYSKTNKIDFILGYSSKGQVLYANDSLDITDDVIKGLNEAHRLKKQKEAAAPDPKKK